MIRQTYKKLLALTLLLQPIESRASLDDVGTTIGTIDRFSPQTGIDKFEQDRLQQQAFDIPELKKDKDAEKAIKGDLPKFQLNQVVVEGNKTYSEKDLMSFWKEYLGKQVNLKDLKDVAKAITAFYRKKGYFLSFASVPAQTVKDGNVKILIVEGYVHDVRVVFEDMKSYSSDRLKKIVRKIQGHKPLTHQIFERYILLIRDLYPYAKGYLKQSEDKADGAADLQVVIPKQAYFDGSIMTNNYAKDTIGPWTGGIGLRIPAPWQREHKLQAGYNQGTYASEFKAASIGYTLPIGTEGTNLGIDALFSRSQPTGALKPFELVTREDRGSLTLMHPFIRARETNLYGGLEFITQNQSRLIKLQNAVTKERSRNLKFVVIGNHQDDYGGMNYSRVAYVKGLRVMGAAGLGYPSRTRTRGSSDHSFLEFKAARLQHIWGPFSVGFHLDGQYAFATLLDISRYRSNGFPYNGAYPIGSISGDSGVEGKIELNYVNRDFTHLDKLRLFTYVSKIKAWNRHPKSTEYSSESAKGMGVGIEIATDFGLTSTLQYGYPFDSPLSGNDRIKPHVGFSLSWRF